MLRLESFPVPKEPDCAGGYWTKHPAQRGTLRVFVDDRELIELPHIWRISAALREGILFHFTVTANSCGDGTGLWVNWHPDRESRKTWMKGSTVRVVYEELETPKGTKEASQKQQ